MWWASVVITISGDLLASSAIRHSLVETLPELNLSDIFPSVGSSSRRPLPSTGSLRARFPGFLGTMSRSDSPSPVPVGSFPRPAVPWCTLSPLPRRRMRYLARVDGIELSSSAATSGPRRRRGLPGSWRTLDRMPCSRLRWARGARPLQRQRCCLPTPGQGRRPRNGDFGAPSHGLRPRCLRFAASVTPTTQDSLPAGGHPWPVGISTRWVRSGGFRNSARHH